MACLRQLIVELWGVRLNPEQHAAVTHSGGPLVVLAGAGTGKTRVLVHRIAFLMQQQSVSPREILAVTFTNKAAKEMKNRLRSLVAFPVERMWVGTFHGIAARMLRLHGHIIGVPPDFTIFDDDDQKRVLKRILADLNLTDEVTPRMLLSHFGAAKHKGVVPTELESNIYIEDYIQQVYPLYRQQLEKEKGLDFGDLLVFANKLLRHKEGQALASRFKQVLVDEFQDTNRIQYLLVKALAEQNASLTVVGDDDQCIYGWRGAEPKNLLDFKKDFPDARVIPLEQNYRSSQNVLDAANSIIANNQRLADKNLWTESGPGELLPWHLCDDEREEATLVCDSIFSLQREGLSLGDMAILYRTHAQSRILEEYLRRSDTPYRVVGGTSFFQRKEIKDILAYIRLAINPAADSCFERIINTPTRGIGKTTLGKIKHLAKKSNISFWDASLLAAIGEGADLGKAGRRKLQAFVEIIGGVREVIEHEASVAEVAIQCIDRSGYRKKLEEAETSEAQDRLANLAEFVSMASDFDEETGGEGTLLEFDERVALSSVSDDKDGRGECISMMTIHAAKGLEFDAVFVVGLEDGLFPSLRVREHSIDAEQKQIEEERRLAYVAVTRAKRYLQLSSALSRREWGEVKFNQPSRFLDEIPERVLKSHATRRQKKSFERNSRGRDSYSQLEPEVEDFDQSVEDDEYGFVARKKKSPAGTVAIPSGAFVAHKTFGKGKVLQSTGEGRDARLLINFSNVGLKTVVARFVTEV